MPNFRTARQSATLGRWLVGGLLLNSSIALIAMGAILGIVATIRVTDDIPLPLAIIVPVLAKGFISQLTYALPVALLFGSGFLVGRLHSDRELLALRSFGVSAVQLLTPVAITGVVVLCFSLYLNQTWVPRFRFALRNVQALILDNVSRLGEGWNQNIDFGKQSIWIRHHNGPLLQDIFIGFKKDNPATEQILSRDRLEQVEATSYPFFITAEEGEIKIVEEENERRIAVELRGVSVFGDAELLGRESSDFIYRADADVWVFYPPSANKSPGLKDRSWSELSAEIGRRRTTLAAVQGQKREETAHAAAMNLDEAIATFHRRLALSLCGLTFPLAAFALGLRVRSGNRLLPFFLASTIIPGVYFTLSLVGDRLAEEGVLPVCTAQLGNFGLLAIIVVCILSEHAPLGWCRRSRVRRDKEEPQTVSGVSARG